VQKTVVISDQLSWNTLGGVAAVTLVITLH